MPIRNARSIRQAAATAGYDPLLECRMTMLGLDIAETRRAERAVFKEIRQRCLHCDLRDACAVDLERDPNNPVWETYCPTAGMLIDLAARASAAV